MTANQRAWTNDVICAARLCRRRALAVATPVAVHDSLTNEFLSISTNRFSRKQPHSIHDTHFYVVDYFSGHLHLIFYLFANFQNRVSSAAFAGREQLREWWPAVHCLHHIEMITVLHKFAWPVNLNLII